MESNQKNDGLKLSREEIEALAAEVILQLEPAVKRWFYLNLGRGLWAVVWKTLLLGLIGLAAYGAGGGHKPWE